MSSWLALAYVGNDLRTEDQSDTADYENIGHVEGGPMRGTDIEIEEICHGSNSHAVHDVAERASEDQTVGNRFYGQRPKRTPVMIGWRSKRYMSRATRGSLRCSVPRK